MVALKRPNVPVGNEIWRSSLPGLDSSSPLQLLKNGSLKIWGTTSGDRSPLDDCVGEADPEEAEVEPVGVAAAASEVAVGFPTGRLKKRQKKLKLDDSYQTRQPI